ncbi:flavin reductase [Prauserella marina]|uniref:NADH-FMN oxidoreductase RutF, flavin reductase (DIM6/NTAB) family n=1 Tax=Prauserella marina TaxID=530584 RepID=A0A222VP66_9PSEU|nr:flavin reductase family protein [Prauserella marina]ASR35715.1 flavin reductase [Prauserella marina]PWV84405.1 flavin reductase (DIM6/NTAB) family NADH-FMN oxidoreductase RutF [Prauserella marina]SDC23385.1 NADH-FMN oxidoreductase RutF, flavin reductase (DIM6/NTAB) family [Prauserella marina]
MSGPGHTAIEASSLDANAAYRLLTGVIVPRPVAWITSMDADGALNLAPFSAFTMVSNDPPMIGVNIGRRAGRRKDTAHNIACTGEYVVNIPSWRSRNAVHESGRALEADVDEIALLGLETTASDKVAPPRLSDVPVSMECRLAKVVSFGRAGSEFTVGEVLTFHVRTDLLSDGKIDTAELDPAARLAGPTYGRLGEVDTLAPLAMVVSSRADREAGTPQA